MSTTVRTALRGLVCVGGVLAAMLGTGCSQEREPEEPAALVLEGPIVAVPRELSPDTVQQLREGLGGATSALQGSSPETFYLALRKSELGQRWFMSVFLKANYPESLAGNGGSSLGVRVVSFKAQNGKLYAFDVDDTKVRSTLQGADEVVEAWPIVTGHRAFNRLPNASQYVLFDPAAGLDRVMGFDLLRGMYGPSYEVELAFAQRFRALEDGVSFEKLFTGHGLSYDNIDLTVVPGNVRVTATVGITLRRYKEGPGYTPTPLPPKEHFFRSAERIIPDSGGLAEQVALKWNIHPGMQPIVWVLSDTLVKAQQDPRYQGYDLIGSVKRGVEHWNSAFGFPVFTTRIATADESISDGEKNFVLLDPDPSYSFAFADMRANPNNGEIIGASVYLNISWLDHGIDVITGGGALAPEEAAPPRPSLQLSWNGMTPERLCELSHSDAEAVLVGPRGLAFAGAQSSLTQKEQVERFFTYVVMHEVGHTLALRHNFKGSLAQPTYSVMEYAWAPDQAAGGGGPGPYDVAAVRYLYGLSSTLPTQPFCTDSELLRDPDCSRFDSTARPLELFYGPAYREQLHAQLEEGAAPPEDTVLNGVLQYVRAGRSSVEKLRAWDLAVEGIRVPISPEVLAAFPGYGAAADAAFQRVIRRLYLDAAPDRGFIRNDPRQDAQLTPAILAQLRATLLNEDGVRGYPTRRMVVDVLKKLQTYAAYAILREARLDLEARLPGLSGQELLAAEDLHGRIQRATSPYFP